MLRVKLNKIKKNKQILLENVDEDTPIFAFSRGKLMGMVAEVSEGWILLCGGGSGATGYHKTREQCIRSVKPFAKYKFYVEE